MIFLTFCGHIFHFMGIFALKREHSLRSLEDTLK